MKYTLTTILIFASIAAAQTTKPTSASETIAKLKEENTRLKAEIAALKELLAKIDPGSATTPTPTEFASPAAFVKWFPSKMIRQSSDTQLQDHEKMRWARDNVLGKTIKVTGELASADSDEIGQIEVHINRVDKSPLIRTELTARFAGTEVQRKAVAAIDYGQSVSVTGKIADVVPIATQNGLRLILKLDDCQLAK